MIEVETTAGVLKEIFRPVKAITDSCKVQFKQDKIVIPGVDPMNLAVVDIEVQQDTFETYRTDGPTLGIRLNRLMQLVKMADSSDNASLRMDAEKRLLELTLGHKKSVLGLVQLEAIPSQPHVPSVTYPVSFDIPQTKFEDTIETADVFADMMTFECRDGGEEILVRAEGDIDKTEINLTSGDEIQSLELADIENSFGLNLLKNVASVIPSAKEVHVELADDRPIVLRYEILDGGMEVAFTVAPWKDVD